MTLNEAKELFPEVSKERPESAIGYIYVTFEPISGKFYIGKKTSYKWNDNYYGSGHYPMKWLEDNVQLEHWPIQWCNSKDELNNSEYTWIDKFKCYVDIKNMVEGGSVVGAKVIAEEFRQQYREKSIGENNNFYGKSHTEESRQKISDGLKKYFETHDSPRKNTTASEESKKLMKESSARRWEKPENRYQYATKILCVETGEIFNSLKEAANSVNGVPGNISTACRGYKNRKTAYGYHWEYLNGIGDTRTITRKRTAEQKEHLSKIVSARYAKERTDFIPKERPYKGYFKQMKKVQCVETGKIFDCIADAKKAYGLKGNGIGKACRGELKTACGLHWQYYTLPNEENSEPSPLPDYSYSNELGFLERKTCLA